MLGKKHTFHYGQGEIRYYELGEGKPLLFLHGGMMRASTYKELLSLLSLKYKVIVPDLPGYGDSTVPPEVWDFSQYAIVVDKLVKHIDLKEFIVVGHSFGGGIAIHLALENHDIDKLILIDSNGIPPSYSLQQFLFYFFILQTFHIFRQWKPLLMIQIWVDFIQSMYKNITHNNVLLESMRVSSLLSCPNLNSITAKTVIIWANRDELFSKEIANRFEREIPHATLHILKGFHDLCLFEPGKIERYIT